MLPRHASLLDGYVRHVRSMIPNCDEQPLLIVNCRANPLKNYCYYIKQVTDQFSKTCLQILTQGWQVLGAGEDANGDPSPQTCFYYHSIKSDSEGGGGGF